MRVWGIILGSCLLFGAIGGPAFARGETPCTAYRSEWLGRDVRYCVVRSRPDRPAAPNEAVAYSMHGIFGNADSMTWVTSYAAALPYLVLREDFPAATFVSFDTEAMSFFSDKAETSRGPAAYESWFVNEFIPMIERTHSVCRERKCRMIFGQSMGGFGALKTAFRHPELFAAVAVNSPALPPFDLHESGSRWWDYFARHPIGTTAGFGLLARLRVIFPTSQSFDRSDPIALVDQFEDPNRLPALYLDMGDNDEFGFAEGYVRMIETLRSRGIPYEAKLVPGSGHMMLAWSRWPLLRFLGRQIRGALR